MRQRRHLPADRMQVSPPNSIQLSLFGFISGAIVPPLPYPESGHLLNRERPTGQPDAILPPVQAGPTCNSSNYRLSADLFGSRTTGERIKVNVIAIRLAKRLDQEGREATTDEKAILVQFSGWGGLASAFEEGSRYLSLLSEVLNADERQAAAASCLTAFYTPPAIIAAVWQAVEQFGFCRGRILDPGAGIGHFLGFSPPGINDRSEWVAVEKDPIAGLIMSLLYPDTTVNINGLEQTGLINSSFDLVIGNVPFGAYSVYDRQNPDLSVYPIHNYFIGRSARLVKPGGLLALITSSGTLDQGGADFRQWLCRQAETELVGAIRLPSCAFETHTNTSVTTDILFLQRRDGVNRQFAGHSFERTVSIRSRTIEEDGKEITTNLFVNEYFAQRPAQMLGAMVWADEVGKGGLYRADQPTLFLEKPEELNQRLTEAITQLPNAFLTNRETGKQQPEDTTNPIAGRFSGAVRIKGRTYSQHTIIRQYIRLRDVLTGLLNTEREGEGDWEVSILRNQLNTLYDEFTAFFGPLTNNRPLSFLETFDTRFAQVQALEVPQKENGKTTFVKASIFRERVNAALPYPTTAASITDAVNLSMWFHGCLNMTAITKWLNQSIDEITAQLVCAGSEGAPLAFIDPLTGCLVEHDAYLSGNVRHKLTIAEEKTHNARSTDHSGFQANVYALQQVVPPTIPVVLISFGLGSVWLPDELITNFIQQTLQLPEVSARYNNRSRQYEIEAPRYFYSSLNQSLGTSNRTALQLVEAALNSRSIIITKTVTQDGTERTVRDVEATSQAIAAQEQLNELFVDFAREHYEPIIEETFNRLYNTHVPRRFARPSYPHYPNANPAITLRDHQFRAVERIKMQDTMLAHAVGSGKTYTMITGAMELKRLGIARKPLLVVQNSTVEDVARSWRLLYPSAVVYVPQRCDLEAKGRKRFLQRIATNAFDGIIIPQSFLKLIPDDPASEQAFLQEEIDRVEAAVAAAARNDKSGPRSAKKSLVKRLNELRLRLEARRLRQADRKKDNILSFDELGVDALFLDECHKYKRLGFFTSRRGIKGIDPAGSEDALSAMFKCRSVQARQGRVVLATGTPISNTMAEAWTMLRFIAPDHLDEARIATFDQFAGAFGQLIASFELTTTGQFKAVSRFARFVNVRQLSELYRAHVDVVLNDDVVEFQRDQTLPLLKDDGFTKIVLPQTEGVQVELDNIRERLRWFEELTGGEKRENSHIPLVLFGQARKATLDIRLLSPRNVDEPGSKLNRAATEILRLHEQSDSYKGTQLVFADVYQSPLRLFVDEDERICVGTDRMPDRFNLFDELKSNLVAAGIPASEVAVCPAEADKREAVFTKLRTGEVRVMLGTSERMGIGVNVQERLVALHHLDAPNRPTDFEQRNGRIIRQGNLHAAWGLPIEILTYGVDKTLDATAYGRLAIKQKFINQVLKGHLTDPAMSDISADDDFAAMSFDQMMATLSGSQYALAHAAKQLDLSRLQTARKNWQRGVLDAQMQVERARRILSVQVPLLPTLQSEVEIVKSHFATSEQPYQLNEVVVEGVTYTEKLGAPVQQVIDRMRGQLKRHLVPLAVVTVNGLPLTLTGEVRQDVFTFRNEYVFTYQWGSSLQGEIMSGPGLFQSLRQSVAHAVHLPAQCQQRIDRARADEAAFVQKVNEPFRHSQRIAELESEIADLQAAMLRESEPAIEPAEIA